MAISLYDISVQTYLQTVGAVGGVMDKALAHLREHGPDPAEVVETRLREDMLPFRFQVVSVWHHSWGAIEGIRAGQFAPPPAMEDLDWAALRNLVAEAGDRLGELSRDEVNALEGKSLLFTAGEFKLPFTAENFVQSFSVPNLLFHATTTYAILRMVGVPLGKIDFLGNMRIGD